MDDLDDDLDLEIVAANSFGQVYVWHHNGAGFLNPNGLFAQGGGNFAGSPAIADLDGDGQLEILVGSTNGKIYAWRVDGTGYKDSTGIFASPGGMYGSIAVGDIDNNTDMEVVMAGLYWEGVAAFDHTGSFHSGWPRNVDNGIYASPALAELDGDGKLDIVVGTHRGDFDSTASVYIFTDRGDIRPGWPKVVEGDFFSSPVVGDIDADGEVDIVVGSTNGRVYAWHIDGSRVNGWPRGVIYEFYSTAALGDIDNDADVEVVIAGYDALVHVFDISSAYDEETMEWPKLCHDLFNTGLYNGPSKAGIPVGKDLVPERLTLSGYPNPSFSSVGISLGIPSTLGAQQVDVDIFDVLGRHVRRIHKGRLEPGFHNLEWNGTDTHDRHVSSGIYFIRVSRDRESLSRKVVLVR
jgi:hypothetical protein